VCDTLAMNSFAGLIDHTLLRPEATESEVRKVCQEAVEYRFKTVCISPKWVKLAAECLAGTGVLPITVIGFPAGNVPTSEKIKEAEQAIEDGAEELDMVLNRDLIKAHKYSEAQVDILAVVQAADGKPVKVILETSELTTNEKIVACGLVVAAGAQFVKTSTGFSKSGATEEDIRLMRSVVGPKFGVKASGGVRTLADAEKMVAAGATRLGTSASIAIVTGGAAGAGKY